jgi:hypothetical protein
MFGTNISVMKNVTNPTIPSCFSTFHAFISGEKRMRWITATMIIAASVAVGMYSRIGVKNNSVAQTMRPVTIEEKLVFAHDLILTAVFENDQATPYPPKNQELIFASHCPINSLLAETLCLVL